MNKAYNRDILDWDSFPDYDIIWCDPPWEQKMVNYFETLMFKSGQIKPQNTIIDILQKLAKLSHKNKPVFIEYLPNEKIEQSEWSKDLMKNYW